MTILFTLNKDGYSAGTKVSTLPAVTEAAYVAGGYAVYAPKVSAVADPSVSPYLLAQSGVPVILPSSGSSNASGQITLTTALPYQPAGTVGLHLPAGVVVGDATGGVKSVVFSSTTVCQIVGSPVTANASYTQTTAADIALAAISVPGGAMGANGAVRAMGQASCPSNANGKVWRMKFGGNIAIASQNIASSSGGTVLGSLTNRGSASAQVAPAFGGDIGGAAPAYLAVDTTVAQQLTIVAQISTATDYVILERYTVEILPSA